MDFLSEKKSLVSFTHETFTSGITVLWTCFVERHGLPEQEQVTGLVYPRSLILLKLR